MKLLITIFGTIGLLLLSANSYSESSFVCTSNIKKNTSKEKTLLSITSYGFAEPNAIWKRSETLTPNDAKPLKLGVYFMDDPYKIKGEVIKWANEWHHIGKANIIFIETSRQYAHIRISFTTGLNQSEIGSWALTVDKNKPTMELSDVGNPDNTQLRWKSTVIHEFGHALGLGHEHQHITNKIPWNMEAITKDHLGSNWANCKNRNYKKCASSVQAFITNKLSSHPEERTDYDPKSIMHYSIDPKWVDKIWLAQNRDKLPLTTNTEISDLDSKLIQKLYK